MPNIKADKAFEKKVKALAKAESGTDKEVVKFQKKLLDTLLLKYLPLFKVDNDGFIKDNTVNAILIDKLDGHFDSLLTDMTKGPLSSLIRGLYESMELSSEYFIALGFLDDVIDNIPKVKKNIDAKIGLTPTGRVKKGSYLYQLGQSTIVRNRLKQYVTESLTGDKSFLDFQLGFRNLVIGNRRVKGITKKGVMQRYFDQYAYDTFSSVDASVNNQYAKTLGLTHLQYTGSLIDTSRKFCEKRAGKVFTVKQTEAWKNDPDLIDKKTKDSYNPLIERGRYRCRHYIKYITLELYNELK